MTTRTGIVGTLAGMSAATQRLNAHLLAGQGQTAPQGEIVAQRGKDGVKKRIKQRSGDGMNQWEREWRATIAGQWQHIYREPALPLANGCVFKVDFLCVSSIGDRLVIEGHEIKGRARVAGIAKLKIAARLFPWIAFRLVTKRRKAEGGGFSVEEVLS